MGVDAGSAGSMGAVQVKKRGKAKRSKSKKRPAQHVEAPARQRASAGSTAVSRKSQQKRQSRDATAIRRAVVPLSAARVISRIESRDDRLALALLLAPFLIVALSLGAERAARQIIARAPQFIAAAQPPAARPGAPPLPTAPVPAAAERTAVINSPIRDTNQRVQPPATLPPPEVLIDPAPAPLAPLPLPAEPASISLPTLTRLVVPPRATLPPSAPSIESAVAPLPALTLLVDRSAMPLPVLALLVEPPPSPLPALALIEGRSPAPAVCVASPRPEVVSPPITPIEPAEFGRALSAAARAQLSDFVIYNPKYLRIGYPMGDVPPLFGVCTDVIVRAYRALGIDLQALIQETGSGRGDRNIDHRRVEVLRRFLARHGATLPVSDLAEDYQPGDIVTYYRPQNRGSTSHMALVTDQIALSGRPMIVHNRGWGPELEDALFVDMITGHYRFTGLASRAKSEAAVKQRRVAGH